MSSNTDCFSDVEYPSYFFPQQSPTYLNFACVVSGFEPVPIEKTFNYFELGFGRGVTVNVLAAANPQGQFYAADFNPAHVAAAQQLASSANLDNLLLLDHSFAELAEGKAALPQFDFVSMYGVYSWVSQENRRHIVNFLSRYLKPGGVVYLNYNAMPGWSMVLPLQRLVQEHAGRYLGGKEAEFAQVRALIQDLVARKTGYFGEAGHPQLKRHIASLMQDDIRYLAHEYMPPGWDALYHADVVRDFAKAKLNYACPSAMLWAFPHFFLTQEQQDILDAIQDPEWREMMKDYIKNTCFREDIFVRGARRMSPERQAQWQARMGLALIVNRGMAKTRIKTVRDDTFHDEGIYIAVLDALAKSPQTMAELSELPQLRNAGMSKAMEVAALLVAANQVFPYFDHAITIDAASAQRMNLALSEAALIDDAYTVLASPLLGNGVPSGLIQRLVYRFVCRQPNGGKDAVNVELLVGEVCNILDKRAVPLSRGGVSLVTAEERRAEVERVVNSILTVRLPVWRQLGVL